MGQNTAISWTDHTWNPWQGCTKVSAGCDNCYMFAEREGRWGIKSSVVKRSAATTFNKPLKWKDSAKVFTCSWSDFFHAHADEWRDEAWDIIRRTPHLTYQILTKRAYRIKECLPSDWGDGWDNVWLGVSCENTRYSYLQRIYYLANIPARIRFVSAEPLLGKLVIPSEYMKDIHWLIDGGESGPNARPIDMNWFRLLRDQCAEHGVAYWHKQNGGTSADKGGCLLDGQILQQFPIC
jgi:protein gp37